MEEPRKSRVKKTITRTFYNKSVKIPKYESVVVEVSFDEEIEWKTLEERRKKSESITKLLKKDFNETTNELFKNMKYETSEDPVQTDLEQSRQEKSDEAVKDAGLDGVFD